MGREAAFKISTPQGEVVQSTQPFTPDTDASVMGAGAPLTHLIHDKEFIMAFARHHVSKTDANRGLIERECLARL